MSGPLASVLVVDDEPELVKLYSAFLANAFDVRTATTGSEAIDKLDPSLDLVTLDRRMPDLSGDHIANRIREAGLDCKIVMVSAVDESEGGLINYDAYLEKPVPREEFITTVRQVLQ